MPLYRIQEPTNEERALLVKSQFPNNTSINTVVEDKIQLICANNGYHDFTVAFLNDERRQGNIQAIVDVTIQQLSPKNPGESEQIQTYVRYYIGFLISQSA